MDMKRRLYERESRYARNNVYDFSRETAVEWGFGVFGLILGFAVMLTKIYVAHHEYINTLITERKLDGLIEDSSMLLSVGWKNAIYYSTVWVPIVCGALIAYFTGLIVYFDSNEPGEDPPSPFSPDKKNKTKSGHSFHSNYILAVVMGILVAFYMFWRGVSLDS